VQATTDLPHPNSSPDDRAVPEPAARRRNAIQHHAFPGDKFRDKISRCRLRKQEKTCCLQVAVAVLRPVVAKVRLLLSGRVAPTTDLAGAVNAHNVAKPKRAELPSRRSSRRRRSHGTSA